MPFRLPSYKHHLPMLMPIAVVASRSSEGCSVEESPTSHPNFNTQVHLERSSSSVVPLMRSGSNIMKDAAGPLSTRKSSSLIIHRLARTGMRALEHYWIITARQYDQMSDSSRHSSNFISSHHHASVVIYFEA